MKLGTFMLMAVAFGFAVPAWAEPRVIIVGERGGEPAVPADCAGARDFSRLSPASAARARRFYLEVTLPYFAPPRPDDPEDAPLLTTDPRAVSRHERFRAQLDAFAASVPEAERHEALRAVLPGTCLPHAPAAR